MKYILLFLSFVFILSSCKKEEGKGGSSTITGSVLTVEYNKYTSEIIRWYNAAEEDVYIVYGDEQYYGDRVKTDNKGKYEFNYLTKGDYTIYAYSDDLNNYDLKTTRGVNATISSNNSTVSASSIEIVKIVDKGNAKISGELFAWDYDASLTVLKDTFPLADEYVYIAIKDDNTYLDRVKTFYDGTFVFSELMPGSYEVYAYSKANTPSGIVAVKSYVDITYYNQDTTIARLNVVK